jgi:hypothetical protein
VLSAAKNRIANNRRAGIVPLMARKPRETTP